MEKIIESFLKICFDFGKELLNKDKLTNMEEEFLVQLDQLSNVIEKN